MLFRGFILVLLCQFSVFSGFAQWDTYSQTMLNPSYQFSAISGYHGALQVNGVYRNQWPGFTVGNTLYQATADGFINPINSGLSVTYSRFNINDWRTSNQLRVAIAPRFNLHDKLTLLTGLSFGFQHTEQDFNQTSYRDPIWGWSSPPTRDEVYGYRGGMSAGVHLFQRWLIVYQFTTGFGRDESFYSPYYTEIFPNVHNAYMSYRADLSQNVALIPSVQYSRQGEFNYLNLNLNAQILGAFVGFGYRLADALRIQAGYLFADRVLLNYTYEVQASRLNNGSIGSHEFGLRITFFKDKARNVLIDQLQVL